MFKNYCALFWNAIKLPGNSLILSRLAIKFATILWVQNKFQSRDNLSPLLRQYISEDSIEGSIVGDLSSFSSSLANQHSELRMSFGDFSTYSFPVVLSLVLVVSLHNCIGGLTIVSSQTHCNYVATVFPQK